MVFGCAQACLTNATKIKSKKNIFLTLYHTHKLQIPQHGPHPRPIA